MSRCRSLLLLLLICGACSAPEPELPPPPCVWDAQMTDAASRTSNRYLLGPLEALIEGKGVRCLIPPIVRDVDFMESALLFCQYDDSEHIFSAEIRVDPRNSAHAERRKEFVFRRGAKRPLRLLLACK